MEKGLRIVTYTIMKILNILIGMPLAFGLTLFVLSICLVDLILLLLPAFFICNIIFEDIVVIGVPNNLVVQFIFTIVGTLAGCYLKNILKIYVPKWFKAIEIYIKESFTFSY